jgi:hypothetical protein
MLGIDVARRALLLISTPPFRTGGAGKPAPKRITCILYGVMIPYGKCLVNYAQGTPISACIGSTSRVIYTTFNTLYIRLRMCTIMCVLDADCLASTSQLR